MPSQPEYDAALRKLKGKVAKRYDIELLARSAKVAGSFGNEVRDAIREAKKEFGSYGDFARTEFARLGL